jgi:hypothetical protein
VRLLAILVALSLGGQAQAWDPHVLKKPRKPYAITEDAGTVAHVYWNGTALVDTKGNAWAMNGTVSQVAKSGLTPAGAGPTSETNYYKLGTGNDVLDVVGDFTICLVFSTPDATGGNLFENGSFGGGGSGYVVGHAGTYAMIDTYTAGGLLTRAGTPNAPPSGTVNVVCAGRTGSSQKVKLNLGNVDTVADARNTPATTQIAKFGASAAGATFYEVWVTTTTPTDALFLAVATEVKAKLGISAW